MTLDDLAQLHGTDKGSRPARGLSAKHYTDVYEQLLAGRELEPLTVLEIGVNTGASLRMWADYLPAATIIGGDSNPRCRAHAGPRTTILIGAQADPEFLAEAASLGPFDVIVDDGSHHLADNEATLAALLPHLNPAGWYAIEDLPSREGTTAKLAAIRRSAAGHRVDTHPGLAVIHA